MRVPYSRLLIACLVFVASASLADTTCSYVNGVYVCTDGSGGSTGTQCVTNTATGQVACLDSNGTSTTAPGGSGVSLGQGLGTVLDQPAPAPGSGWLSKLTYWFAYAVNTVFRAVVAVLKDLVTYVISAILALVLLAVNSIGVPSWISQYSLGSTLGQTGSVVGFFMVELQIPLALSLVGLGYVFRLVRKFLTLFQW